MLLFGGEGKERGCFTSWTISVEGNHNAVLTLPDDTELPAQEEVSPLPLIVTGINLTQEETVAVQPCFEDRIFTYAFGAAPGELTVQFLIFLGDGAEFNGPFNADGWSDTFNEVLNAYKDNRVSQQTEPAILTFMSRAVKGFIKGMSTSVADLQHNMYSCTFRLVIPGAA